MQVQAGFQERDAHLARSREEVSRLREEMAALIQQRDGEQARAAGGRRELEELTERHAVATGLVRSLKAELVRQERRVREMREETDTVRALSRRHAARADEAEAMLVKRDKESSRLRQQAQQASTILQQLTAVGGAAPQAPSTTSP